MRKLVTLALLAVAASAADKWTVQYFYDKLDSDLRVTDFAMPSATHGVLAGAITYRDKNPKPVVMVTTDGGTRWTEVAIKEIPRSIFFLNDSLGWMVTEKAIWFTDESGRSWRKVSDQPKPKVAQRNAPPGALLKVAFIDAMHGYGVGSGKTALETKDGGKTWVPIPEAEKPTGNPAFTAYSEISINLPRIVLGGTSIPPQPNELRGRQLPTWMDPEAAKKRKTVANMIVLIQSIDGGKTWSPQSAPLIGSFQGYFEAGRTALSLFRYPESFEWPTELFNVNATGQSASVFREKNRRVTSVRLFAGPDVYLAAVEPPGSIASPIAPGKIRMLHSSDLRTWTETPVDYRAVASGVLIAGPDPAHLWAATDNGMVLRLESK